MTKGDNGPMRQGHVNGENLLKHDAHKIDGLISKKIVFYEDDDFDIFGFENPNCYKTPLE